VSSFFADDSQINGSCRPSAIPELQTRISACIDDVAGWMRWLRLFFLVVWTTETWRHPQHLLQRLQSVMNAAARLVHSSSMCRHITPLLRQLHWLKAKERIDIKLAVLVYKCMHGLHRHTLLMNLVDVLIRRPVAEFDRVIVIISRPSHSPVNRRRSIISRGRLTRMERSASAYHCCTFSHSIS